MITYLAMSGRLVGCLMVCLGLGIGVAAAPAAAADRTAGESEFVPGAPIADASLAADVEAIAPGIPFTVAVRLKLPAGWHTYWINPGEAGAPTNVEWHLPNGFTADAIGWPTPERIVDGSIVSYGYWDDLWLTSRITPPASLPVGSSASIKASVDWLACAEICVPEQADLTLALPVETTMRPAKPEVVHAFAIAADRLPRVAGKPITVDAAGSDFVLHIEGLGDAGGAVTGAEFFPAVFGLIDDAAPQKFERTANGLRLILTRSATGATPPAAVEGVLVVERARGGPTGYNVNVPLRFQ